MSLNLSVSKFYFSGDSISSTNEEVIIPYSFSEDDEWVGMFVLGKFPQFGCAGHKHVISSSNLNVVHWCTGSAANFTGIGCRIVSNDFPNGTIITFGQIKSNNFVMIGMMYQIGTGKYAGVFNYGAGYVYSTGDVSYLFGGNLKWEPIPNNLTVTYPQMIRYIYFYNVDLSESEVEQLYRSPDNPPRRGLVSWIDFSRMVDLVRGGVVGE